MKSLYDFGKQMYANGYTLDEVRKSHTYYTASPQGQYAIIAGWGESKEAAREQELRHQGKR